MSYDALCIWLFWDSFLPSNVTKSLSTKNGGDTRRNNPPNKIFDHASISNFQLSNLPVRAVEGDSASQSFTMWFLVTNRNFQGFWNHFAVVSTGTKEWRHVFFHTLENQMWIFFVVGAHIYTPMEGKYQIWYVLFWISAIHKIDLLLRGLFNGMNAPSSTSQVFSPFFPSCRAS